MPGSGTLSAPELVASAPDVTYLADHPLVITLPFVLPVLLVVVMVAVVAYRDRRRGPDIDADEDVDEPASAAPDGSARAAERGHL